MYSTFLVVVRSCCVFMALGGTLAAVRLIQAEESDVELRTRWRKVFDETAADYQLTNENEDKLTLLERPVYTWARSGANHGSYGAVYIWTNRGNAEALACLWRDPGSGSGATLVHELHSLSPDVLRSSGKDSDSWKPKAGLKRMPLPDAPPPAKTATARLQQMRGFCRNFTARSVSVADERTELRLLPQPLYRFQSEDKDVIDGALFAYVCSIGTDPEVFLLLEAQNTAEGPQWHFAPARFSHMDLYVSYKDRDVWQALRDEENTLFHNAEHTYFVIHGRKME